MHRLVLATNNPHKVREIRSILRGLAIAIVDSSQLSGPPEPSETGKTLAENAVLKARAFHGATGEWALADDSGLEIDALHGAPGVMSSRFAGPGCTYADNNRRILELMADVPERLRTARFRCVAALVTGGGDPELFEGTVEGVIISEPRGDRGFGYDPIFYSGELGQTFAEASPEDKNSISHRARAFEKARRCLEDMLRRGDD